MASITHIPTKSKMEAFQVYGRLTAVARVGVDKWGSAIWSFRCECGNEHITKATNVRRGRTRSCGCFQHETIAAKNRASATHGMRGSREYETWNGMIQRCSNASAHNYQDYGGRGIMVCERWRESFENFYSDMGERPSKDHSLDRINNAGNYEPENCKWSTRKEQHRNKRNNHIVMFRGVSMTLVEAAERSGLEYQMVWQRLQCGWNADRALSTPAKGVNDGMD